MVAQSVVADVEETKKSAQRTAQSVSGEVLSLSHSIHAEPEVAFEEVETSRKMVDLLKHHGFSIETGVADLETAFVASYGSGELIIGICAELDALPGVGHACGHNIIASAGVLAGLSLASVADRIGITVKVFGTPAEEFGGGKIFMLRAGVFDGVHAAMMVHPGSEEHASHLTRSVVDLEVKYTGRPAHSAMAPFQGINAGDAATVAQVAIGLLRQHLRPGELVHGIVTSAGDAPNVVPHHSSLLYDARANTIAELEGPGGVKEKMIRCFEAGAVATGCDVEIKDEWPAFSEFRNDDPMVAAYRRNAEALGRVFTDAPMDQRIREAGSTDMANVSLEIPAIHPSIYVEADGATCHQPEFAQYCVSPSADRAVIDGGTAMCWTAIDMAADPDQRQRLLTARTES
ncbi:MULTISPECIES: M20 family metallopeptidase [Micrococcaceae]|uniref:M20 family metallopeptidase n=1 Tax=unclassified Kocuria TaxID=2649579 RepID=UPI001EE01370|nr:MULTISPECIES: M20 family metallopeptidase [unclassified Kocuria]